MQVEDQAESLCCVFGLCSHSASLYPGVYMGTRVLQGKPGSAGVLEGEKGK